MTARRGLHTGLTGCVATLLVACSSPDFEQYSCTIRCEASCPGQLECRGGWCVQPGATCPQAEPGETAEPTSCTETEPPALSLTRQPLPRVCVGEPIEIGLSVDGGSAPYFW